ncbi:MAG: hemerythrin [Rhodospirillaceae bacterium]|nr:MAG: hemerythrin [Rhodospirillaceae bacterium]
MGRRLKVTQIEWNDGLKLGLGFQDQDHEEAIALMNAMQTCSDADFPAAFAAHTEHLAAHLARENELMERIGFFAKDMHMGEHERVLAEVADMQAKIDAGDIATVRAYVENDLPQWFKDHLGSMDMMTAQFALQMGET